MTFEELEIALERKAIKHLYLSIDTRSGQVKIKAPLHMPEAQIRAFVEEKKGWITKKLTEQHPMHREQVKPNHPIRHLGHTYQLDIRSSPKREAYLEGPWLVLALQDLSQVDTLLKHFRKQALLEVLEPLIEQWSTRMGVRVADYRVRDMHTRWGSCTPHSAKLRFSLALSKAPLSCIEYVVVHELTHLLETAHSKRFYTLMEQYLPDWKERKRQLTKKLDDETENGVS